LTGFAFVSSGYLFNQIFVPGLDWVDQVPNEGGEKTILPNFDDKVFKPVEPVIPEPAIPAGLENEHITAPQLI
jgi:hypothetical protein